MDQKSELKTISYNHKDLQSKIDRLNDISVESSYYLILMLGQYTSGKKKILSQINDKLGEFEEINLAEYVNYNEKESFRNIDELFKYIGETEKNLLFKNGDVLSGEYTGFTYSSQKYATPQSRYLLKKIQSSEKFIIIDFEDTANVDKSMERYSQLGIRFDEADSLFGKLLWRLKQIRVQGHTFAAKRTTAA